MIISHPERPAPALDRPPCSSSRAAALRGMAVIGGPPLLLDAALGLCLAGTLAAAVHPSGSWPGRGLRRPMVLGTVAALLLRLVLRPWHQRWGARDSEVRCPLPGDDLIPHPVFSSTRATGIAAPPERVWPWLVQIGTGRGGWYSYDRLERLAGVDIHSAGTLLPELQSLHTGDTIAIAPGIGFRVVALEPERALVLRSAAPDGRTTDAGWAGDATDVVWTFALMRTDCGGTRLIARYRADGHPRRGMARLLMHLIEAPHFVMERRMLLGIKQRAEESR